MPASVPQSALELKRSLSALARAIDFQDPATFEAHQAPGRLLKQALRVRDALAPYRRLGTYLGALGNPEPGLAVAQLPFVENEDWVGRSPPPESRLSFTFISMTGSADTPDPESRWRGLLLDEWTELVPNGKVDTGVAFHYDSQNSEAPQVVLLATHSGTGAGKWTLAELAAIVNETIDLAGVRPVDADRVSLGQLTPAICLAANLENKTVSTTFPPQVMRGRPVVTG